MIAFQQAIFPLLIGSVVMIAGYCNHSLLSLPYRNTGFPCILRFLIWILFKASRNCSERKKTFAFLLDHPRRCFTLLFPAVATWWLFGVLLLLNLLDLFFFIILDLGNRYVLGIPLGYRIVDGLFQVSTPFCRSLFNRFLTMRLYQHEPQDWQW
jgi:Trk-type K+ transport system membrane component